MGRHKASFVATANCMSVLNQSFASLPFAEACRRIDFDFVEVCEAARPGGSRLLLVSGVKPWADLCVTLEPVPCREVTHFRVIEVVGRLTGSGLPALVDFCVALPLAGVQGCKGIEVVGATKSERRELSPSAGTTGETAG